MSATARPDGVQTKEAQDAADLEQLQAEFEGKWRIWRPRYHIEVHPTMWCATRRDYNAGVSATVVRETVDGLRRALLDEAEAAAKRVKPSW